MHESNFPTSLMSANKYTIEIFIATLFLHRYYNLNPNATSDTGVAVPKCRALFLAESHTVNTLSKLCTIELNRKKNCNTNLVFIRYVQYLCTSRDTKFG